MSKKNVLIGGMARCENVFAMCIFDQFVDKECLD